MVTNTAKHSRITSPSIRVRLQTGTWLVSLRSGQCSCWLRWWLLLRKQPQHIQERRTWKSITSKPAACSCTSASEQHSACFHAWTERMVKVEERLKQRKHQLLHCLEHIWLKISTLAYVLPLALSLPLKQMTQFQFNHFLEKILAAASHLCSRRITVIPILQRNEVN